MPSDSQEQLATELLGCRYDQLTDVQRSVIDLIATEAPSGVDPRLIVDDRTAAERLADRVAAIGGSWAFICGFGLALSIWIGWNLLTRRQGFAFDPYPFIFLNLMLSMLAAVQAPLIMMSQNRAAARDRQAAEYDYLVNLRAELEIMHLHDKVDRMRHRELLEVIRRQNETLRILRAKPGTPKKSSRAPGKAPPA